MYDCDGEVAKYQRRTNNSLEFFWNFENRYRASSSFLVHLRQCIHRFTEKKREEKNREKEKQRNKSILRFTEDTVAT